LLVSGALGGAAQKWVAFLDKFKQLARHRGNVAASRCVRCVAIVAAIALTQHSAAGAPQSVTWDGDSSVGNIGDGINWTDPNNWSVNGVPDTAPNTVAPGDNLTFGGGTVGQINLDGNQLANSLTFNAGFTLDPVGSSNSLALGNGAVNVGSGVSAAVNANITGSSGLILSGGGTLTLNGSNGYSSGTTVTAGTLTIAGTLSLAGGTVNTASTGTINLNANSSITGTLTNSGSVYVNAAVMAVGITNYGNFTIALGSSLNTNTGFSQQSGTLTINGSLTVDNQSFVDQAGTISGTVLLTSSTVAPVLSFGPSPSGGTFNFIGSTTTGSVNRGEILFGNIPSSVTVNVDPSYPNAVTNFTWQVGSPTNAGTLNFRATMQNHNITVTGTSINNTGTININPGPTADGQRLLQISVTNSGNLNCNASATIFGITNTGNVTIAAGKTLISGITQTSGALTINGALTVPDSTFADNGGTISGTITLTTVSSGSTLSFGTNAATGGTFNFIGSSTAANAAGTLTGTIPASAVVNVDPSYAASVGTFSLGIQNGLINNGTLNLLATNQNHGITISGSASGTLTNAGTMNISPGPTASGSRMINVPFNNSGTLNLNASTTLIGTNSGTFNVNASSTVDGLINSGTVTILAGKTLTNVSYPFTQSSGALNINGTLTSDGVTFNDNGGTITGTITITSNSATPTLSFGSGSPTGGTFNLIFGTSGSTTSNLAGNGIPSGVTVNCDPSYTLGVVSYTLSLPNATFTNAGTLNLLATGQNHNIIVNGSALNNSGTLNINPGPTADGSRTLNPTVSNSSIFNINASTTGNSLITNSGTTTIAVGKKLTLANFTQSAGTLNVNGTLSCGGFDDEGGTINGTINLGTDFPGVALTFGANASPGGTFVGDDSNSTHLYGTGIPTGATVTLQPYSSHSGGGNFSVLLASNFSNAGTLNLNPTNSSGAGENIQLNINQAFYNSGTLNLLHSPFHVPFSLSFGTTYNSGVLNMNADTSGSIVNTGTVTIATGVAYTGYFTQSTGTLTVNGSLTIDGTEFDDNGGSITGPVTLAANSTASQTTLAFGAQSTNGLFNCVGNTTTTSPSRYFISGTIPSGATINIEPAYVTSAISLPVQLASVVSNAGTINLLATGKNHSISISGFTFTNTGTINVNPGPTADGGRSMSLTQFTNSGSFNINASTTVGGSFVNSGSVILASGKTLTDSSTFAWSGGNVSGNGTLVVSGATTITNSVSHTGTGALVFSGLTVSSGATLDISGGTMIVHGDGTQFANIWNLIHQGYNSGQWNGNGIISSAALSAPRLTALGTATGVTGTFDGQSVVSTDVVVKYTWYGDADLSGKVDGGDYTLIDTGYGSHGSKTGWQNGDFNYDGQIDGSDYSLIDNAFNQQSATPLAEVVSASEVASSSSSAAIPEPASLGMLAVGAAGMATYRRRRRLLM
jgi:fibronectin-binding autotransporter adhesin